MSINWTIKDLVGRLRKTYIPAKSLAVGDVVITGPHQMQIVKIEKEANGFISFFDEDDNGQSSSPPNQIFIIIDRSCFGR